MQLPDDVEDLQLVAEYHTARRALRRIGWGGIVFGLLNLCLALFYMSVLGPINAVLALISLALLVSGVCCLVLPGAEGVIGNGVALILTGLWNIFVTIVNIPTRGTPQIWWAMFGVFMIVQGVQSFRKYSRFSAALRHGASKEEMAMMDGLVQSILRASVKENEDIVAFQVSGFGQQKQWRGKLEKNVAIFVDKVSKEMMIAPKEEVSIVPYSKVLIGKTLKATVKIAEHKWEALVSPESFDNYRHWKFSEDEDDRVDEADEDERKPETGIQAKDEREEEPPTGIKRQEPRPEEDK